MTYRTFTTEAAAQRRAARLRATGWNAYALQYSADHWQVRSWR